MADISEQYKTIIKEFPQLQDNAMLHFNRLGFPTVKNEEWKYTNVSPIINKDFSFILPESKISSAEIISQFPFLQNAVLIVLENGKINVSASDLKYLAAGCEIKDIIEIKNNPLVQKHFGLYADINVDAFAALNTAFAGNGLVIIITKNSVIEKPVYIVNVSSSQEQAVISHDRLLIVAERNSQAKISCISISKNNISETFATAVNEIVLDENVKIEFNMMQDENEKSFRICNTYVYQLKNSTFTINTVTTGGSIVKNKLHIKSDDVNCETHLYGLYVANNSQLMDNHTAMFHSKPNCNSNQLYKGIIGGKAHAVFNGKILVEKDAQKTNAYQSNKNILLSNDAVINAKPQLEIFADDVKCTHGATTGQMDDEALFYLRSRGINENNAKALLNLAFVNDILNNISIDAFREYVSSIVESSLIETE